MVDWSGTEGDTPIVAGNETTFKTIRGTAETDAKSGPNVMSHRTGAGTTTPAQGMTEDVRVTVTIA